MPLLNGDGPVATDKIRIAIDRGGTFTDCLGIVPGRPDILVKLLSHDPSNYADAPTEGIRRILETLTEKHLPRGQKIDTSSIGENLGMCPARLRLIASFQNPSRWARRSRQMLY